MHLQLYMYIPQYNTVQRSGHTGREWLASTITQPFFFLFFLNTTQANFFTTTTLILIQLNNILMLKPSHHSYHPAGQNMNTAVFMRNKLIWRCTRFFSVSLKFLNGFVFASPYSSLVQNSKRTTVL